MEASLFFAAGIILSSGIISPMQLTEAQEAPKITSNTTIVDVVDEDIAHFKCSARGDPTPSIKWLHSGKSLTNTDRGVKILSISNAPGLMISHLLVAVTDSDHRGHYVCVASNSHGKATEIFIIKEEPPTELTSIDYVAIGLSLSLTVGIVGSIAFFMLRWHRNQSRTMRTRRTRDENAVDLSVVSQAYSNELVEGSADEIQEISITTAV